MSRSLTGLLLALALTSAPGAAGDPLTRYVDPFIGTAGGGNTLPGYEHHTPRLVREIMRRDFGTGPWGLPGNDDAGTISAWYVFSALGFYPVAPASGEYRLGIPLFDSARIQIFRSQHASRTIEVIRSEGKGEGRVDASWNGRMMQEPSIDHDRLVSGERLEFMPR